MGWGDKWDWIHDVKFTNNKKLKVKNKRMNEKKVKKVYEIVLTLC